MKKEDMYNAVSSISPDILDQTDAYMTTKKAPKTIHWKRWIAVAACFALMLCASIPLFPGKEAASPFVITAYAMEAGGEVVGTPFEINQTAPMTQLELSSGLGGFLFSVDLEDKNEESQMNPFILVEGSRSSEIEEVINRYTEEKGKAYFYFVPDEEVNVDGTIIDVTCGYTRTDGSGVLYVLQIVKDSGNFTAQLMDVTEHPNGIPKY